MLEGVGENFYAKQEAWSGIYTSEVSDYHRHKASLLQRMVGGAPQTVLELGTGGGQVAFATAEPGYHVTKVELIASTAVHAQGLAA